MKWFNWCWHLWKLDSFSKDDEGTSYYEIHVCTKCGKEKILGEFY